MWATSIDLLMNLQSLVEKIGSRVQRKDLGGMYRTGSDR